MVVWRNTPPDYEGAKRYVLERLSAGLSPDLTYHSLRHTRDDVLPAAMRLGRAAGLDGEGQLLLNTAALFHDTGFLISPDDHERRSIELARATLPGFGYSAAQIEAIEAIIGATRMPQRPQGLLQELMCDADLDLFGRDDFMSLNRNLLTEARRLSGRPISEADWLREQARFMRSHHYFTAAAVASRAEGKARNLARLDAALNGASPASRPGSGAHAE